MVDDFREDQILIPYPMTKLRFWRNTASGRQTTPGKQRLARKELSWLRMGRVAQTTGFRPAGLIHLSLTTLSVNTYLLDYGHTEGPGIATHSLSLYRDPAKRRAGLWRRHGHVVLGPGR